MAHSSTYGPSYYKRGGIDVWDFIRDQGLNFHLGNAIKYICRAGHKESAESDLKKAIHYLNNELENLHTLRPVLMEGEGVQKGLRAPYQLNDNYIEFAEEFDR